VLIRDYIFRAAIPISKAIGHLYIAPKYRKIRAHHIESMEFIIESGDVVLSFSHGELSNYFIEGDYKHSAICSGGKIIEAVGPGVRVVEVEDFCASKDRICILRPLFCSSAEAKSAGSIAASMVGKPYDFLFEPGNKSFYCAELIQYAYQTAMGQLSPFIPREIMGVQTVLPNDFNLANTKFLQVAEYPGAI
jgi:hypothetical protein